MWAGEMNTFGSEFRIARANDDKTFGWKICTLALVQILLMKMNPNLVMRVLQ